MTSGADALPSPKGNADDLVSVSQRLGQMRERAAQTVLVQRGPSDGAIRGTWTGEAAVARTAEATSLAGLIGEVADRLPVAGTALTTFGSAVEAATTAIEALQEEWDAAEAEYRSRLRSINTDPRYRDLPQEDLQSMADHYAGVRDDTHAELVRAWDRQMTTLREAEGAAAQ